MEAIVTRPHVRPELIPDHVREDVCEVAFNGYIAFERYLSKHPEEARHFEERVAEVRNRRISRHK